MDKNYANKSTQLLSLFFLALIFTQTALAKINIVAAENFYGDIAQTIGGDHVTVTSVMTNPQQDPHLFSPTPSVAREVSNADIVIYNGGHYSEWMPRLLSVPGKNRQRKVIVVANELPKINANRDTNVLNVDENPHIWYDPDIMWAFAQNLTTMLIQLDRANKADYQTQLAVLEKKQAAFKAYIAEIKPKLAGQPFALTDPIFDYMGNTLKISRQAPGFAWGIENDGAPSASAIKEMLSVIEEGKIKALIYNQQVNDTTITNIIKVAHKNAIPIVTVTETQPEGLDYYEWMQGQLQRLVDTI
jgi:zinc/manganese transport system substrate-binding protein